jgi:hypothetical protein
MQSARPPFSEMAGGAHNIGWTHAEECNKALLEFFADGHYQAFNL